MPNASLLCFNMVLAEGSHMDIATAYFNVEGFALVQDALRNVENFRSTAEGGVFAVIKGRGVASLKHCGAPDESTADDADFRAFLPLTSIPS